MVLVNFLQNIASHNTTLTRVHSTLETLTAILILQKNPAVTHVHRTLLCLDIIPTKTQAIQLQYPYVQKSQSNTIQMALGHENK